MSKIVLKRQSIDLELQAQGLRRVTRAEFTVVGDRLIPIYREILIDESRYTFDKTPWWKRSKRRKKS